MRYQTASAPLLEEKGLIISGVTPDDALVESIQWPDHPWGIGVQVSPGISVQTDKSTPTLHQFYFRRRRGPEQRMTLRRLLHIAGRVGNLLERMQPGIPGTGGDP